MTACIGDHPRSCGKDVIFLLSFPGLVGSPPLVRERLFVVVDPEDNDGITPARAGKTLFCE